jgi:hypothetical protein
MVKAMSENLEKYQKQFGTIEESKEPETRLIGFQG